MASKTITPLSMQRIFKTWWPLAISWLLMGAELPAISAVMARLPNPEISLAAYGGVIFPLALIIEAPIIMLLAASTALSKDWASYVKLRKFMNITSASLTGLHILVVFTPLYYVVVKGIIGAPEVIVEPARVGLMILLPWTWSIAYRRFNQGVLIRFGHSRPIGVGTVVRLSANWLVLLIGFMIGTLPGIVVGACAVSVGVVSEAIFIGIVVRPVLNGELKLAPVVEPSLTFRAFMAFYIPLAMTSLLTLIAQPIGSAALSRMPEALVSLAAWPVIMGLVFMFRSMGIAFNEVVVALLDEPYSSHSLRRFSILLSLATTAALLLVTATPFSRFWLQTISALPPHLAELAQGALWIALPLPALNVWQSWFQGAILHGRHTRAITEAVFVYLLTSVAILVAGVRWGGTTGLYIGILALTLSVLTQTAWLWIRSRNIRRQLSLRDAIPAILQPDLTSAD